MPFVSTTGSIHYDAIVVGSRVAGASTAMLMARRGMRVLMLDRRQPGTDTLSTHAQMRGATLQLQRWGLLDRVKRTDAPPIRRTTFHYGDATEVVDLKPSAGVEALFAPRRTVLDTILVDAAREAGVDVRFGVTVQDLLTRNGRVIGVIARSQTGQPMRVVAPITIGADGVRSVVARRAGATVEHSGANASAVIYGYWSGPIADGYEWFYRPGSSAGLIPTNHGETCAWVSVPSARFMRELRGDLEGSFHRVLTETTPEGAARLRSLGRRERRFAGFAGIPGFLRRPYGPGWALVGDSSHFKDPLSAHGITDALRDAEFLADAVANVAGGSPEVPTLAAYAGRRDDLSLDLHTATDQLAAYRWDLARVRELLFDMNRAMKHEVEALMSLDHHTTTAAAA
jgi:flavin-dependent dehydrogenase